MIREVSGQSRDYEIQLVGELAGEDQLDDAFGTLVESPAVGPGAVSGSAAKASADYPAPTAADVTEPAPNGGGGVLGPHRTWQSHGLPPADMTALPVVVAGLREIIAAEGPIHAQGAYRSYVHAAGGQRVGREMRRYLDAAARQALRRGVFCEIDDGLLLPDEKTFYMPGTPPVVVRELGPRQLSDVPRSEVAALIKDLGLDFADPDMIKRAVLDTYGLIRLTAKTSAYLDECQTYSWRPVRQGGDLRGSSDQHCLASRAP